MDRTLPSTAWEWAVVLGYLVIPWVGLSVLGQHKEFKKAVGAGVLFALIATFLDHLGVSLYLWWYPEQPFPLVTGNALWNIVAAIPSAILINEIALAIPNRLWHWIGAMTALNATAEVIALQGTDLMAYPNWSPLFSVPVYVVIYRLTVWYTRWVWKQPAAAH